LNQLEEEKQDSGPHLRPGFSQEGIKEEEEDDILFKLDDDLKRTNEGKEKQD